MQIDVGANGISESYFPQEAEARKEKLTRRVGLNAVDSEAIRPEGPSHRKWLADLN